MSTGDELSASESPSHLMTAIRPLTVVQKILVGMGIPVVRTVNGFVDDTPYIPFVTPVPVQLKESNEERDRHNNWFPGPGAHLDL